MKKKKKKNCQKRNRLIVFKTSTCSFNSPVIIVCVCVFFFKLSLIIDLFFLSAMAEDRGIDATSTVEKVFKLLHTKI